ncbi:hypothetical protein ACFSX9_00335 [Flavobacterium ardleyense]|uniref:Uncharacterized protein n=1 Tax=Flavobacterium ardleyense TaxID=2038737 RepID=A0ABW5Z2W4_9FLAO
MLTVENDVSLSKKQKLARLQLHEIESKQGIPFLLQYNLIKQFQMQKELLQMQEKFQVEVKTLYFINNFEDESLPQSIGEVLKIMTMKILEISRLIEIQELNKVKIFILNLIEVLLNSINDWPNSIGRL